MPLLPPRSLEPYRKKELLGKREEQLRHALAAGMALVKVHRAAEAVRAAHLAILKAEQELIRYKPDTEQKAQRIAAIAARRAAWQSVPIDAIVEQYSAGAGS
jgi:hypothetical protein